MEIANQAKNFKSSLNLIKGLAPILLLQKKIRQRLILILREDSIEFSRINTQILIQKIIKKK